MTSISSVSHRRWLRHPRDCQGSHLLLIEGAAAPHHKPCQGTCEDDAETSAPNAPFFYTLRVRELPYTALQFLMYELLGLAYICEVFQQLDKCSTGQLATIPLLGILGQRL